MTPVTPRELHEILSLQLLLAWAGETPGGAEPRLGWWRSDAVDPAAGGDLFKRLLPRTHSWAGLTVARRSARTVDDKQRRAAVHGDKLITLFHFGFELDEALEELLASQRHGTRPPTDVHAVLKLLESKFDRTALQSALQRDDATFKVTPLGRQLKRIADEAPVASAQRLAAALLAAPGAKDYPAAHIIEP